MTAFKAYELLPAETNFYQYNYIGEKWTPKSASPLNVHVTFGLNHKRPLDWRGKYENFRAVDSGKPRWDPVNVCVAAVSVLAGGPSSPG